MNRICRASAVALLAAAAGCSAGHSAKPAPSKTATPAAVVSSTPDLSPEDQQFVSDAKSAYGFSDSSDEEIASLATQVCQERQSGTSQATTVDDLTKDLSSGDASAGLAKLAEKDVCPSRLPAQVVEFEVSGHGYGLDISYGSDSDNRQGGSAAPWQAQMAEDDSVEYYAISAQLSGSGDISCEIVIEGVVVATGHASGGYNICSAQVGPDGSGGWTKE